MTPRLPRDVIKLGLVSFLTDVSTEMIFSVFAIFFTTIAGASSALLGLIEGLADFSASSLDYLTGWQSDRSGNRKAFVVAGYGFSTLAKTILLVTTSIAGLGLFRIVERLGKGFRGPPRDAWLSLGASTGSGDPPDGGALGRLPSASAKPRFAYPAARHQVVRVPNQTIVRHPNHLRGDRAPLSACRRSGTGGRSPGSKGPELIRSLPLLPREQSPGLALHQSRAGMKHMRFSSNVLAAIRQHTSSREMCSPPASAGHGNAGSAAGARDAGSVRAHAARTRNSSETARPIRCAS